MEEELPLRRAAGEASTSSGHGSRFGGPSPRGGIRPHRYMQEPTTSFIDKLKGPGIVLAVAAAAVVFVLFSTYLHYNLDQAPHRMFKMLLGGSFLVALFMKPEKTVLLLPFALPYSELLPVTPIPLVNSKNILIAALLLSWIGHGIILKRKILDPSPWNRPLLAFIGYSVFSVVFGVFYTGRGVGELYPMMQSLWNQSMGFVLFFVTYNTVRTKDDIQQLAYLYCVGAGLGAIPVLREYGEYSYGKRVGGGMGDINGAGAYFAGAIVVTLEMMAARFKKAWHRVLLIGALIGSGVGLILPASRGAILACSTAAGMQAMRGGPVRIVLVLATALTIVAFTPQHVKDRFLETQDEVASGDLAKGSSGRTDIWKATIDVIETSPVLGVGWGQLPRAMKKTAYGDDRVAHNLYLELWAQMGLPGLVLMLWLFWIGLKEGWALRKEEGFPKILGNAFVYYMIVLVIANVFGGRLFSIYSLGALGILAALVFRTRTNLREEREALRAQRAALMAESTPTIPAR